MRYKKFLYILGSFLFAGLLLGDSWNPNPPLQIASNTTSSGGVFSSYDPISRSILATWTNGIYPDNYPYYAFYDGNGWTTPAPITTISKSDSEVITSFDTENSIFLATYEDVSSLLPFYTIYNGINWTPPAPIPGASQASGFDVSCAFASSSNTFLVLWGDATTSEAFYATYAYGTNTWSSPNSVPNTLNFFSDIYAVYSPNLNFFLVTWVDGNTNEPAYSTFDGSSWSPYEILAPSQSSSDVIACLNSNTGTFFASWIDTASTLPAYATYDGTSWGSLALIPGSLPADSNIVPSYDPVSGKFVVTWIDNTSNNPFYAIFDGSAWTVPQPIPNSTPAGYLVRSAYFPNFGVFAAWPLTPSLEPFYSVLSFSSPPQSPANFKGKQKIEDFGFVFERVNSLSWDLSPAASGYHLYRNGILIATVGADVDHYKDHNQSANATVYTLVAFNQIGTSSPVSITVSR